jgi:hypothetical protein
MEERTSEKLEAALTTALTTGRCVSTNGCRCELPFDHSGAHYCSGIGGIREHWWPNPEAGKPSCLICGYAEPFKVWQSGRPDIGACGSCWEAGTAARQALNARATQPEGGES